MKTLKLELRKNLLIVDSQEDLSNKKLFIDNNGTPIEVKFICKGSELTEEIARSFLPDDYKASEYPEAFLVSYKRFQNAFIVKFEAKGFYWLENPKIKLNELDYYVASTNEKVKLHKRWKEAESKTFKNPLIFKLIH